MPKKVHLGKGRGKTFEFPTRKVSRFPWADWFKLTDAVGEDDLIHFEGGENGDIPADMSVNQFVSKLKGAARKRGKTALVSRHDVQGRKLESGILVRTRPMTTDEQTDYASRRAARKEKAKVKRAKRKQDRLAAANNSKS